MLYHLYYLGNRKSLSDFGAHPTFNSGKMFILDLAKEGMTVLEESEEPRNDEL